MTRLSSRQYQLAKTLLENLANLDAETAGAFNQTTLNSFMRRGYLKAISHGRLSVTRELHEAMAEFNQAEIYRKYASLNLGSYVTAAIDEYDRRRRRQSLHKVA